MSQILLNTEETPERKYIKENTYVASNLKSISYRSEFPCHDLFLSSYQNGHGIYILLALVSHRNSQVNTIRVLL